MNKRSRSLQSSKYIEKKRNKNFKIIALSSLCGILFIIIIILILRLNFFQINQIEIVGSTTVNIPNIQQQALSQLDGNYLFFIPKSNFLFYPKSTIKSNLLNLNKNIDSLSLKYIGNSKIGITIKDRESNILVCEGFHDENNQDDNCFYADENGYVFAKAPQFSNGVYDRYYLDSDLGDNIIGTNFIKQDLFANLQKFVDIVKKAGLISNGILISNDGEYEFYSKNTDASEVVVYFNDRTPFDKTASNLISFIKDSQIKKKNATTTPVFDSINLRFGNNIFYVTK